MTLDRNNPGPCWTPFGKETDGSGDSDVFHVQYDPEEDSVVEVVVSSVAAIHNCDPLELTPLGDVIDPETVENLVEEESNQSLRGGSITLYYEDLNVTIDTDGDLWLEWE